MTIFAPAARHFFVHASAPALAPLAPHLSSLTQPLTVALFPISSNAIAVRANTKHIARHSTNTFLIAGFSPFRIQIAVASRHNHCSSKMVPTPFGSSRSSLGCEVRQRKYTTRVCEGCQETVKSKVGTGRAGKRAMLLLRGMGGGRSAFRRRRRDVDILSRFGIAQ